MMKYIALGLLFLLSLTSDASARWRLEKNEFKNVYQLQETTLPLRGVGVKTLFMMRLFVAALYLDKAVNPEHALDDVPKHLEVKFYTKIPGSDFAKFTIKSMKSNVSAAEFKRISDRFDLMRTLFPDIKTGDVFSLTYNPGEGTIFTLNGNRRGVVPGADFAKAIYATWLGAKPIDHILKRQVLGVK